MSNWSRLLRVKGPGTSPQSSELFQRFRKIFALTYQSTKFGDFMSYGSKYIIPKRTLSHVVILIMTSQIGQIMGWLKIQKLEYL